MPDTPRPTPASQLAVEEAFATQDPGFLATVRACDKSHYLAEFANRWKVDPRPWARQQALDYVDLPMSCPGHHPVVKRLFKHAERTGDPELMGAFLVAFDRLVRRRRVTRWAYDRLTRSSYDEEALVTPGDQLVSKFDASGKLRKGFTPPRRKNGRLFSYRTRRYLARRAWRFFRRLARVEPQRYVAVVSQALARHKDADLAQGENLLDSPSLMKACFRHAPQLVFGRVNVGVAPGHSLGDLSAAPAFAPLWQAPSASDALLSLLESAQSRLVRVWAMELLRRHHLSALSSLSADTLLRWLDHADPDVQQFAASLAQRNELASTWPVTVWLRLLQTRNPLALATLCDAVRQQVRPDRLDLAQCVALASASATPVARLGLDWLADKPIPDAAARAVLCGLAEARCEAVGQDAATLGLGHLGAVEVYTVDVVSPFFDSRNPAVRAGAWDWLTPTCPAWSDPALWARLTETPHDDARARLVRLLAVKANARPRALAGHDLSSVWASVLLNVQRGGRAKLQALRQVADALAQDPARAEHLLPSLRVALRSVRPAEARAGLAAIVSAVARRPGLRPLMARHVPELDLGAEFATDEGQQTGDAA